MSRSFEIEKLVKPWEDLKKLRIHSPAYNISRRSPKFHPGFYNKNGNMENVPFLFHKCNRYPSESNFTYENCADHAI